ncbi:hypothetical protein ARMSODRAFT_1083950 [Armillaria solidipes]|uniref:Heterokaryon incompatibility domain-containing protein n=1 Tax=Armillaria solidipes TaxID=1076256 RepID=A0A2H3BHI6_9AGAR|nr:hypothetical protein ARMSODRAFT_1083950 [Armillaria solidipes]
MNLSNRARSYWNFVELKTKSAVDKWMDWEVPRKSLEDELQLEADRGGSHSDSQSGRTGQFPEVTISSQTEIGQTEESIKVPNQRAYTSRKPVIPSSLANIPCSSLDIQDLLDLLNTTLGTSYTLDTPSLSFVLKDCIAKKYDFGTAYGHLRSARCDVDGITGIHTKLWNRETEDIKRRRDTFDGSRIVHLLNIDPRRVWDLYSNRVVPWWCCSQTEDDILWRVKWPRPISHAWVDEADRVDVWTPINGYEWPVPIPKGANLDLIRIEMLNLGMEYTWLDVLCLRQRGGLNREDLRVEEWKLDVPTIGAIYKDAQVVWYLSGLGLPLDLKEGDLESDRSWFRRAWTLQEVGQTRTIAGDTLDGPMHAEPIDDAGNYKDELLTNFHKQLKSVDRRSYRLYSALSAMQNRTSTYPVDKVAGLGFFVNMHSVPPYYESQSLEDAWTALINEMELFYRGLLFLAYPEPGTGCQKWRPSWEQVMTKSPSLPDDSQDFFVQAITIIRDGDIDIWCEGPHIEKGFVRGLAVAGVEGINRHGKLVVEDADGMAHAFNILASHQYPIPEGTYTLLGSDPFIFSQEGKICWPQYWVVGRRLPSKRFEKVSVFKMTDSNEIKRLEKLGLSARSRNILV